MNEYWTVIDNRSGKIICHCGDINDAIMMVNFDSANRTYRRQRFLMDQIVDVTSSTDKQLPGQLGLPSGKVNSLSPQSIKLPQSNQNPIII